jgi:signal peptidase
MLPAATAGILLLLPLAILFVTVLLLGWQLQVIETASMAPRYPAGSLAVVDPLDPSEVRAGMTIVFEDPQVRGRLEAHRVVKRLPAEFPIWQTKGDANAEADPFPVPASSIRGRVRWAIPFLGRAASHVRSAAGAIVLVGAPFAALIVTEIRRSRRRNVRRVQHDFAHSASGYKSVAQALDGNNNATASGDGNTATASGCYTEADAWPGDELTRARRSPRRPGIDTVSKRDKERYHLYTRPSTTGHSGSRLESPAWGGVDY